MPAAQRCCESRKQTLCRCGRYQVARSRRQCPTWLLRFSAILNSDFLMEGQTPGSLGKTQAVTRIKLSMNVAKPINSSFENSGKR